MLLVPSQACDISSLNEDIVMKLSYLPVFPLKNPAFDELRLYLVGGQIYKKKRIKKILYEKYSKPS